MTPSDRLVIGLFSISTGLLVGIGLCREGIAAYLAAGAGLLALSVASCMWRIGFYIARKSKPPAEGGERT